MADKYWVARGGGASNDNWSPGVGVHWSTTSGGAANTTPPGSSDRAIFDANSPSPCNINNNSCSELVTTNWTGTLAGTGTLTCSGNFELGTNVTRTWTGALTLSGSGSFTINGKTMANATTISRDLTLTEAWNNGTSNITHSSGTFDTAGFALTCGIFNSNNTTTRAIDFDTSTVSVTGWRLDTTTNLTATLNACSITNTMTADATLGFGSSIAYKDFTVNTSLNTSSSINGTSCTFEDLIFTNTAGRPMHQFQTTTAITASGSMQFIGNNANSQRILVRGFGRTLTSNGTTTLTNVDFHWTTGAGSATWSGTSVADAGGNSGITFTTPVTRYWVGNAGNWSDTTHWSTSTGGSTGASMPIAHDTVIFDANSISSASQTVTVDVRHCLGNVAFTGVANTPTLSTGVETFLTGNVTLVSGMSVSGTGRWTTLNTLTLNTDGKSQPGAYLFDQGSTRTVTLGSALVTTNASGLLLNSGTFATGNFDVTTPTWTWPTSNTGAVNLGSSTVTINGAGTIWGNNAMTNITVTPGTSTIKLTDTSSSLKTFNGRGKTYYNLWITGAGTGEFTIDGNNTFNDFKADTPPHTINFTAATTQTLRTFTVSGTAGNIMTLQSSSITNDWFLDKLYGNPAQISVDYLSLRDSTVTVAGATGTGAWFAGVNSSNVSNNDGWTFDALGTTLGIQVFDAVTVTDVPNIAPLEMSLVDTVTITEAVTMFTNIYHLSVFDTVTIVESVTTTVNQSISVFDNVVATDVPSISQANYIVSVFEAVLVVEDFTPFTNILHKLVFDTVTVTDVPMLFPNFEVFDSVTITESITLFLSHRNISVSDNVSLTENLSFFYPTLVVSISDTVTITENISFAIPILFFSVIEEVTLTEFFNQGQFPGYDMPLSAPRGGL